jgi:hypothetical protein
MGTTIIFNVDLSDARFFTKDLQGKVDANDIATLETGEAIARVGTEIIKMKTLQPISIPPKTFKDEIIQNSLEKYYRNTNLVKKQVKKRLQQFGGRTYSEDILEELKPSENKNQRFTFDEFE